MWTIFYYLLLASADDDDDEDEDANNLFTKSTVVFQFINLMHGKRSLIKKNI